jgi:hypothetical protein
VIGALSATAQRLTRQMHGFHGHAPRLPQAGKRMLRTMGFYARAPTAPLAHIRMPQFPARSFCKLRVVRPLRAAPATCAWCDKEEPQHPSFFPMTMPGWTFINVYAHDRYPRDPAIEGLQGGQLGPKTDEDWHTQNEVNTLFFFFISVLHRLLTWRACTWRTCRTTRPSHAPSPETSLPFFVTSLTAAVSRLSRFRPQGYLAPRGTCCSCAV